MPVSGLVLRLSPEARTEELRAILEQDPRLEVGSAQGLSLPLVSDTRDRDEDRALQDWLRGLSGVVHLDVAFIHFDDPDPSPDGLRGDDPRRTTRHREVRGE